jgi:amino acid adenylation domain-containing protein
MSTDTFVFPTSFAQRRLWFVHQLEPGSPSYNITTALKLSGQLDTGALEHSLDHVIARHEALRTTFRLVDGEPVQVIAPELRVQLPFADRTEVSADDRDTEIQRLIQTQARLPFDLQRGPLLRAQLVRLGPDEHVLILVVHHIVFDGWSAGVLSRELSECYRAFTTGNGPHLPELPVQYADFAVWQREWLTGEAFERQLAYWRTQLAKAPTSLDLPTDFQRPQLQTHRGSTEKLMLSPRLLERLTALSREEGATLFMTLLAGFQLLLSRYAGQKDIVVGSPIANRPRSELEHLVGFFVNSLALRTDLSGNPSFRELLRRVRKVALGAYAHQNLPFERLVEELNPERVGNRNPFFQVMFVLQNAPRSRLVLPGITIRSLPRKTGTAKFDLTLHMHQLSRGLMANLEYNTDLFEAGTITRMLCHLERLLEEVTTSPDRPLSSIPLLSADEQRQVLYDWNQTARPFPTEHAVHQLFEHQATIRPDAIALEDGSDVVSYAELNRRANRLARYLQRQGVGPEVSVGVAVERSADLIVALLAVLKAGGAYVPLDSRHPAERLAIMLEDGRVSVLITMIGGLPDLPDRIAVVRLDGDRDLIAAESEDNLITRSWAEQLAYVMHTSGSTGGPKAIGVPHRAIVRLVLNTDYLQLTPEDRVAQVSNTSFDAATFEIWGALLNGGRLVLIHPDVVLSPREFAAEIRQRGITAMFLTTALFNLLAAADPRVFETVHSVLFGGEAADPRRVREVVTHGRPQRLLHVYGPTEVTTFATWFEVRDVPEASQTVPIGRPIANTIAYVLDGDLMPVSPGIPGELCLGGPGLARGYVGRPGLTADRFVPDAFGSGDGLTGGRLYRTGDRVRLRPDGTLEFLGRFDEQIKLRGFRIEPAEIEAALAQHPAVGECAVVMRDDLPGGRGLVAYLAPLHSNGDADSLSNGVLRSVRAYLRSRLPQYMIPAAFVVLERLPLSPSGKIARRALPLPQMTSVDSTGFSTLPQTDTEKQLAGLWEALLGRAGIGLEDNFFDLGGHSLLAVRLFADIERTFGRKLPLSTLFQAPTLRELAQILSADLTAEGEPGFIVLQGGRGRRPLYVVHGIYGDVMQYRQLAKAMGPDQPVYGFEARCHSNGELVLRTIEELAATYTRQMRATQPSGPYFLCGYCWAGPLAFEMARQLRAAGQDVGLLALIDSPRPGRWAARPLSARLRRGSRGLWSLLVKNGRRLARVEPKLIPAFIGDRLINAVTHVMGVFAYRLSVRLRQPLLPKFREVRGALLHAERAYRPAVYTGPIVVFRPTTGGSLQIEGESGWGALTAGGIDVREVPGEHHTIMQEPYVRSLAMELRSCLDRARQGST